MEGVILNFFVLIFFSFCFENIIKCHDDTISKISHTLFQKSLGLRSDDGVVGAAVDGAADLQDLAQLLHDGLDLRDQGARGVDELALVDRDVGVERRDQELADALGAVGIVWVR